VPTVTEPTAKARIAMVMCSVAASRVMPSVAVSVTEPIASVTPIDCGVAHVRSVRAQTFTVTPGIGAAV